MVSKKIILSEILVLFAMTEFSARAALLYSDSTGTILTCTTAVPAKDFVVLYDNVEGIGRPLSATFIESDGTANTAANNYTAAYANTVDGVAGAFGVIIPNLLPNGIRRIERRSFRTGAIVAAAIDADGMWPSGGNTVNPTGGATPIVLTTADVSLLVGVHPTDEHIPTIFSLSRNYPNPFNPSTKIQFSLDKRGVTTLKVYDVLGKEIATLVDGQLESGTYTVDWNAAGLSGGLYFYEFQCGNKSETRKMVLMK